MSGHSSTQVRHLVITSGHKMMGAPTSGMICGRKELIRACYLQNWGIGRAMKVRQRRNRWMHGGRRAMVLA